MAHSGKNMTLILLLILLISILLFLNMVLGSVNIPLKSVWNIFTGQGNEAVTWQNIIWKSRFPQALTALVAGAGLAVSGLQMQTVFRNPLADPYLLGVSSGAGLGVAFFILGAPLLGLGHSPFWQSIGIVGAGWVGAVAVLLLVAVISRYVKNILGVLIMGVMIGYIAGAVIQILQYLSSAEQLKMFYLWSMGSLGHVTSVKLWIMWPMVALGLLLAVYCMKPLNLLLLGEQYARTMGIDVRRGTYLDICLHHPPDGAPSRHFAVRWDSSGWQCPTSRGCSFITPTTASCFPVRCCWASWRCWCATSSPRPGCFRLTVSPPCSAYP